MRISDLQLRKEIANKKNIKFDDRTIIEIYDEYKKKGISLVPVVPPDFHFKLNQNDNNTNYIFNFSGISNRNTIYCNEGGEYSYYISDKYGFNNSNKVWEKENFEEDIAIIGDSFVHGACVDRENNIPSNLAKLSKKNVINLGFSSTGPLMQHIIIKEYLIKVKPKKLSGFIMKEMISKI